MTDPQPFVVLRVRPDTMGAIGLTRARLFEIGFRVGEGREVDQITEADYQLSGVVRTVTFRATVEDPQPPPELLIGATWAAESTRLVLIDLDFPVEHLRQGFVDTMMALLLRSLLDQVSDEHRVVVITHDDVQKSDHVAMLIDSHERGERVLLTSRQPDAQPRPASWALDGGLRDLVVLRRQDLLDDLRDRTLRRRGVFITRKRDEHIAFYYSAANCIAALTELLVEYLNTVGPEVLLYDGLGRASWVKDAVMGSVPIVDGVMAATMEDLMSAAQLDRPADESGLEHRLRDVLADANGRVVLVVPLMKSGNSLSELVRNLRRVFQGEIVVLSILIDDRHTTDEGVASLRIGEEQLRVDYFVAVEQRLFTSNDWQLVAATRGGYVEDPDQDWRQPSLVGLWTLYEELGIRLEKPVPPSSDRLPVRWFPQLPTMKSADARWLAEAMVRVAEEALQVPREALLLIIPNEDSGARPIATALRRWLDVAVLTVERDVFEGDRPPDDRWFRSINEYPERHIVIADESTVTYGTITNLTDFVTKSARRTPSLAIVALELAPRSGRRPEGLRSLHRWTPIVHGDTKEEQVG